MKTFEEELAEQQAQIEDLKKEIAVLQQKRLYEQQKLQIQALKEELSALKKVELDNVGVQTGSSSVSGTATVLNMQYPHYPHPNAAGFTAEDANAISDILKGHTVQKTGPANTLNGPDRIVDGQLIQTKYYQSAYGTVNSAFGSDGNYKYSGQILEVPKDQYSEAVEIMANKIRQGHVPGVSDPNEAKNIVKAGDVTYKQAHNIAKAGNIDSLVFDIKTQSITTAYAFGISTAITFARLKWSGFDTKEAFAISLNLGIKSGAIVLTGGVLTQQFLRTSLGRSYAAAATKPIKTIIDSAAKTQQGRLIISKLATTIAGKQVSGTVARNTVTKFLRTNTVTNTVFMLVMTAPDAYKAVKGKMSWEQCAKNFGVNGAGLLGGMASGAVGGSFGGPIGMFIGGMVGGMVAAYGSKKLFDLISSDDAENMMKEVQNILLKLSDEYLMSDDEIRACLDKIQTAQVISPKYLETVYQKGNKRDEYIISTMEPFFEAQVRLRSSVHTPTEDEKVCDEDDFVNID